MVQDLTRVLDRNFTHYANFGRLMSILAIALAVLAQALALFLFVLSTQTHTSLVFGLRMRSMWWAFFVWLPGLAGYTAYIQLRGFMQDIPDARKYLAYWISSTVLGAYTFIMLLIVLRR